MVKTLVKLFIKDSDNTEDPKVRGRYGVLSGAVGIFLNLCLFTAKVIVGTLTSSISVTADAFNNLSDAGSSVVTLIGFKMACMPADKEHPFGHGRIEYLSGLIISVAIIFMGFELFKSSIEKIIEPQAVEFSWVSFIILLAAVAVKLWMSFFNKYLGKKINSGAMKATSTDSLSDAVATSAVAVGLLVSYIASVNIDGWIGLMVSLFILYSGIMTAKDSLSPLLGQAPDLDFVKDVENTVLAHDEVVGIHDLIVHDYGPGRRIISLHAEVPSNSDILVIHDAIDIIELELRHKFSCDVTIHMDPIAVDDESTKNLCTLVKEKLKQIDENLSIHDFRMVEGKTHTNLIFDVTVPYKFRLSDAEVGALVRKAVQDINENYFAVIHVEKAYI